ncbi:FixH family protein [Ornithinibacillus sp. 4-3]|uniref:FixH family protein n=1 Tax=Ornithinibacillus sp. 4-3 TaxID=3231488 RepID=A0AB39HTV6_9BACI
MLKYLKLFSFLLIAIALVACGSENNEVNENNEDEELPMVEVEFEVPEHVEVNETVTLKATVMYGDELLTEVDELNFEYWKDDDKENSITEDSINQNDGTYTLDVAFEEDGVYSIYAHTTAKEMHTMPLRKITVGSGTGEHEEDHDADHSHDHHHAEGFHLHFMEVTDAKVDEEIMLMVHLQMDDQPLENAKVRYEIINESDTNWADAEETVAGEYVGKHTFEEAGTYSIQIHVEDDEDLHEHETYEIEVQ